MDITMVVVAVILLGFAVAVGVFLFQRMRKVDETATRYFRCPGCHSKIRYFARQAGHQAMCGNCRQRFTFPAVR
jgi:ribosomal protein L37AE/L43A